MTSWPVLVPTATSYVGATVDAPDGKATAALMLLPGLPSSRSGPQRMWARAAGALASEGVVVLRPDYPGRGETPADAGPDVDVLTEVLRWFRAQTRLPLALAGSCYGAALALRLAAGDADTVAVALLAPHLRTGADVRWRRMLMHARASLLGSRATHIDGPTARMLRVLSSRCSLWVLTGEDDAVTESITTECARLGESATVETLSGAIHSYRSGTHQDETIVRLTAWARRSLTAHGALEGGS